MSSSSSLPQALINECVAIAQQSPSVIQDLVNAAKGGGWTSSDTQQLAGLLQPLVSYMAGYDTVGIIVAGMLDLGLGAEDIPGVVTEVTNLTAAPYYYNFLGVSIGAEEGGEASVGILIAKGEPDKLKGFHTFGDAAVTVGAGVTVQYSSDGQWFVFVSAGEELDLSVGGGHVTVKQL